MSDEAPSARKAEMTHAALSLVEIGQGAMRRNDVQMAQIYLGVAEKLFEKADDAHNARKARVAASSSG